MIANEALNWRSGNENEGTFEREVEDRISSFQILRVDE